MSMKYLTLGYVVHFKNIESGRAKCCIHCQEKMIIVYRRPQIRITVATASNGARMTLWLAKSMVASGDHNNNLFVPLG